MVADKFLDTATRCKAALDRINKTMLKLDQHRKKLAAQSKAFDTSLAKLQAKDAPEARTVLSLKVNKANEEGAATWLTIKAVDADLRKLQQEAAKLVAQTKK